MPASVPVLQSQSELDLRGLVSKAKLTDTGFDSVEAMAVAPVTRDPDCPQETAAREQKPVFEKA
jgi:hypothetical protein